MPDETPLLASLLRARRDLELALDPNLRISQTRARVRSALNLVVALEAHVKEQGQVGYRHDGSTGVWPIQHPGDHSVLVLPMPKESSDA